MYYRKNNIDISYQNLVRDILENGVSKGDRTGTGTVSVFGRQIRHKMADGFPLLTTKRMSLNNISSELIWFLRGDTNIKYLLENKNYIWVGDAYKKYSNSVDSSISREEFIEAVLNDEEFCSKWGELGPIYGRQWRAWENFEEISGHFDSEMNFKEGDILRREPLDQLKTAIESLKANPDSRRIIVSAWNPNDLDKMTLPPCHNFFQLYTRELSEKEKENYKEERVPPQRAISLMWNQRSVDTALGLPYNIASYALLLEIIGKMVNMIPDELIGNLGDTHLYNDHVDIIKEQLDREPFELPILKHQKTDEFYKSLGEDLSLLGHLDKEDFILEHYYSHSVIKMPLSN